MELLLQNELKQLSCYLEVYRLSCYLEEFLLLKIGESYKDLRRVKNSCLFCKAEAMSNDGELGKEHWFDI